MCTEWMARQVSSRISDQLALFHDRNVACFQWGLVKEITYLVKRGRQARGRAAAGFLGGSQDGEFSAKSWIQWVPAAIAGNRKKFYRPS